MKKKILVLLFITISYANSYANEISLSGIYQGENLVVNNPLASTGVGYCVYEVLVNDQLSTDEIQSSSFEIDFASYGIHLGDKISVIIKHKNNCKPKIVNKQVLKAKSTFKITSMEIDRKNNLLKWKTSNERGQLPYFVEQYKWNKWIRIATVQGTGNKSINMYSVQIKMHSGENKFRVKQIDYTKKAHFSSAKTYRSLLPNVTHKIDNKSIVFSSSTEWEIFNYYGESVKKGYSNKVDISRLPAGSYFLNYDNAPNIEFRIK